MASNLDEVKQYIQHELTCYEDHFKKLMKSNTPLLDKITHYIVKSKGKQMRPMFVFLSARIYGDSNPQIYTAASMIELLHTASLVHDDIVDESFQRRGFFSINALWKNKIAVLVGDYLLAQGLNIAVENHQYTMLDIVNKAVKSMAEGELLQLEKARRLDIKEDIYFDIIKKKTAFLIAASCALGSCANTNDADIIEHMRKTGENIGMAFQIKDDLFDYGTKDVGKPLGIDIKEKKMTLPLIYTLNHTSSNTRKRIIGLMKKEQITDDEIREIIDTVKAGEGIAYTIEKMNEYKHEAIKMLGACPQGEATQKLKILIDYVIDREK